MTSEVGQCKSMPMSAVRDAFADNSEKCFEKKEYADILMKL